MWNLKTRIDSQTQKKLVVAGESEIGAGDQEEQAFSYKINKSNSVLFRIESTVDNIITSIVTNGNWTQCGNYFIMYKNIKPLCCTYETNITLYVKHNLVLLMKK